MAPPYAPRLTRFRAPVRGVVRDFVEHEGKKLLVRREDCRSSAGDEEDNEDQRECMEIEGRVFPLADETKVAVRGGGVLRCVEYSEHGVTMRLAVTERKEVAEVVAPDGELRVLGSECYSDHRTGTVEHMVDVQGEVEAFVLLVSVREELGRIVRVQRLN